MKKAWIVLILVVILFTSLLLVACKDVKSEQMELVFIVDGEEYARKSVNLITLGTLPENPPCDKDGYSFEGWYFDEDFNAPLSLLSILSSPIQRELKVYANFDLTKYEIKYKVDKDVEHSNPKKYTMETAVVLKNAYKEGYIFKGWYLDEGMTQPISFIRKGTVGDMTLYADFEECLSHLLDDSCECTLCGRVLHTLNASCICTDCGLSTHTFENCVCTVCGKINHTPTSSCICSECNEVAHRIYNGCCSNCGQQFYSVSSNIITIGSYPQSLVKDGTIIASLNNNVSLLPSSSNANNWISYNYYTHGTPANFMWYKDVTLDGEKYRGVIINEYRPSASYNATNDSYYQSNDGYTQFIIYWFRFEPIKWNILSSDNGEYLLVSTLILDSQEFNTSTQKSYLESGIVYPNNYAQSSIRKWLNENFYKTAFSEFESDVIVNSIIDNSGNSLGGDSSALYASENTKDSVFLLSASELITYYGNTPLDLYYAGRVKYGTDYAQIQGLCDQNWWTRSPNPRSNVKAQFVTHGSTSTSSVCLTYIGVVPAIRIMHS